jgi:hypothetical protein
MAALFDVDLEEIAEVVERRGGMAEKALLLDRGGLGVGLRHDEPAHAVPELAGDDVPDRLAGDVAEADRLVRLGLGEEDPPAVLGHLDVVEVRPAPLADPDRRPEIDLVLGVVGRAHVAPPLEVVGLPVLEGAAQNRIVREVDVVRDLGLKVDAHLSAPSCNYVLLQSNLGRSGWP